MENPQFEIFMKVVNKDFKGFAIIFHEDIEKRLKISLKNLKVDCENKSGFENDIIQKIRKQVAKHQTFKFIKELVFL